jgi:hypothetical protein
VAGCALADAPLPPSAPEAPELAAAPTQVLETPRRERAHRRWIAAVFALASIIGVFAVLSVWVNRQVLNTDNWTTTSTKLLEDPKIQSAVGAVLVSELFKNVDVASELKKVLPSEVSGLAAPAAAGLRALANQVAPQVLASAPVQEAWRQANKTAQLQLLRILNGGTSTVSTENGVVVLKLHPLLNELAAQLGLQKQLEGVRTKLQGGAGEAARGAAQEKLGVTLPPPSGNIVILRSNQLKTAQNVVKAVKSLAVVLPALAILLFLVAMGLAMGWRRIARRTTGWCFVAIGLAAVLARRLLGDALVESLVKVPANREAVHNAFEIGTNLLYDIAIAMITYGLVIVLAAWLAGHTRPAAAVRRALAPSLREHIGYVYGAGAVLLLLVVLWGPFPSTRQLFPVIGFAILIGLGIRDLQKKTAVEFPDAQVGDASHAIRAWLQARRGHAPAAP